MFAVSAVLAGLAYSSIPNVDLGAIGFGVLMVALVFIDHLVGTANIIETETKNALTQKEKLQYVDSHINELRHKVSDQEALAKSLRESNEKYRHAAFHDSLTNLPNRESFIETLRFHYEKSRSSPGYNFAVLFLDLNRFKTINDSLGHSIGDQLILFVAERLSELTNENDLVARFSGDEFGMVLSGIPDLRYAQALADRVKQRLQEPFLIEGRQVFTSVSIGIAGNHARYTKAEEVLRDADIAMYHAKESKVSCVVFDQTMHSRAVTLLQLETDLRAAIKKNELCAYYQPIVALKSLELIGFEALIRWNHPKRGLIPPGEFIPIAEETGLIIPITLWMLFHSCRQLVTWNQKFPSEQGLILSVNLSGKHFEDPNLVKHVSQVICETTVDPISLKLELTESAIMDNAETSTAMLKQLKALGVQLSIDDFGTGYSSLSYLHRFPIDTLKVDRSFVGTMEDASENGEIVKTVIGLARALRMNVVAEGIETIHQLHQLRILGCEYGQGFLFSRPVPIPDAEEMLFDRFRWKNILPEPGATQSAFLPDAPLLELGDSM
jgi:diguanylate cyclase (GGDEF)-like protein